MIELPLAFGNVTLAGLVLLASALLLWLLIEAGLKFVYYTLAMDTEDAPEFKMKNPLSCLYYKCRRKFGTCNNLRCIEGRWYVIETSTIWKDEKAFDEEGRDCWRVRGSYLKAHAKSYGTKEEAKMHCKYEEDAIAQTNYLLLFKLLVGSLTVDTFILLLGLSFLPTVIGATLVSTIFCVRTLAKKFYSGMKNHSERIEINKSDIQDLKDFKEKFDE